MKFFIVDCFAQAKYEGNQLAVFIANRQLPPGDMQKIAREMNFSEVSFILSGKQANGGFDVRIFTPATEVPFAGHPVIGTAHVIHMYYNSDTSLTKLNLACGQIPIKREGNRYFMTQNQPVFGKMVDKFDAAKALSIDTSGIREDLPAHCVSTGLEAVIVPLKSLEDVAKCKVDHAAMADFHTKWRKCNLLVFAHDGEELVVRVFMDDPGYLEDPATGSANGNLAAYLLHHACFSAAKVSYTVRQGVEMGRPSTLFVNASMENGKYLIRVGGEAVSVATGKWL